MRNLPLPHAELSFYFAVLPIKLQYNQRTAFYLRLAIELVDLLPVQQQPADALCRWDFVAGAFVRLNVRVIKERFAIFDSGKRIADVGLAGANRFDLAPFQLDSRFVALKNMIIAERFPIDNRFARHIHTVRSPEASSRGELALTAKRRRRTLRATR